MEREMFGNSALSQKALAQEATVQKAAAQGAMTNESLAQEQEESAKESALRKSECEAKRERSSKRDKTMFFRWRVVSGYAEEQELLLYRDLCGEKRCLALVGNSQEDHCVYSAWVAFEMVRYYDRDIEALEEMHRYLAVKADEVETEPDWKEKLSETVAGFFGRGSNTNPAVDAAYYQDARDVVTEILKLRKGLKTFDGTLG